MITMLGTPRKCCDGMTRRETLQAGGLAMLGGMFGISQDAAAALVGERGKRSGKAKSVIVLYLLGGAPTQDMWDLKPEAPPEIRGTFQPISTDVPGTQISEILPRCAKIAGRFTILRSHSHRDNAHQTGRYAVAFHQATRRRCQQDTWTIIVGKGDRPFDRPTCHNDLVGPHFPQPVAR